MDEEEILALSENEIEKIERVNNALEGRFNAEAEKEAQLKLRILFERAARDALPFIVFIVYVGAMNAFALIKVLDYEGTKLWIGAVLVTLATVVPLFMLPRSSVWWLKGKVNRLIPGKSPNADAEASDGGP